MEGYGTSPLVQLQCEYINDGIDADAQGIDADGDVIGAGDVAVFEVPFKCAAVFAAVIVTETIAINGSTPRVKFDRRHTAGADGSSRTDGTLGDITIPDATAAGTMVYDKACQGALTAAAAALLTTAATCRAGGGWWDSTNSVCKRMTYGLLEPGNEVVVQVIATAGTGGGGEAGHYRPILVVRQIWDTMANLGGVLETA